MRCGCRWSWACYAAQPLRPGRRGGGEPINLNATLTVTLTERPATAVLDEITRKTGIKFAYDPEDIRRLPAVSGEFKKVTVHELLDKCIAGSTFKYAIENNVVLVYDSTVKMRKFCLLYTSDAADE